MGKYIDQYKLFAKVCINSVNDDFDVRFVDD